MSLHIHSKVNRLQHILDEGLLAPSSWFEEQGYSRALLSRYVKSGWLTSPARGVYRRPGPPLKWQNVVASLQMLLRLPLHIGGRTALEERGLGHYVRMNREQTIVLYGHNRLPAWVNSLGLPERFETRSGTLFTDATLALTRKTWGAWEWPLTYATEERAILELLDDVPKRESIYDAYLMIQGLAHLRPTRVTALLAACTSIKVKRLFLALTDQHQHQWLSHLDLCRVNLGIGKRVLIPGGALHAKYLITLPSDLDDFAR